MARSATPPQGWIRICNCLSGFNRILDFSTAWISIWAFFIFSGIPPGHAPQTSSNPFVYNDLKKFSLHLSKAYIYPPRPLSRSGQFFVSSNKYPGLLPDTLYNKIITIMHGIIAPGNKSPRETIHHQNTNACST